MSDEDFEEYRARILEEAAEDENEEFGEELNDCNEIPMSQNMTENNEELGKKMTSICAPWIGFWFDFWGKRL